MVLGDLYSIQIAIKLDQQFLSSAQGPLSAGGARLCEATRDPAGRDVYLYSGVSNFLVLANHFW